MGRIGVSTSRLKNPFSMSWARPCPAFIVEKIAAWMKVKAIAKVM